ncbi:MAG TPA: hypothetical protein VFJ82_11925 [Longimicrobium sp.]|nr:hypothetical protein [Longimicrobium sp.]
MKPDTPIGFYLCGIISAAFCAATVAAQFSLSPVGGESPGRLAVRGLSMLLVPLAAVVTEALWRARPWAYRASVTLAVVYASTLAAAAVATRGTEMMGSVLLWMFGSTVVVVPMLGYIHARTEQLWPRGRVPARAAWAVRAP